MTRPRRRRFIVLLFGILVLVLGFGISDTSRGTDLLPETRSAVIDTVSARDMS
jgi:hypothetical protein